MVTIAKITAWGLDCQGNYRNYRICPDGIKYQSDCPAGNATSCSNSGTSYGWSKDQLITMAGQANMIYFNGELVVDSGVPIEILNQLTAEAVALREAEDLAYEQAKIQRAADYLNSKTAIWDNQEAYSLEVQETTAEINTFNAELEQLLQGKAAGTTTQPAGTQPVKVAGLNPLIPVALALAGVAAVVVMAKVKA